jgi:hypothetical protein
MSSARDPESEMVTEIGCKSFGETSGSSCNEPRPEKYKMGMSASVRFCVTHV